MELQLDRPAKYENKWLFDQLQEQADAITEAFEGALDWRRLDDRKVSIICCKEAVQGYSQENWPDMIGWLKTNYVRMESVLAERVVVMAERMRSVSDPSER